MDKLQKPLLSPQNKGKSHLQNASTMVESQQEQPEAQNISSQVENNEPEQDDDKQEIDESECSINQHPKIKTSVKIWMPALLSLNILMYIYCNIAVGASVQVGFKIMGLHIDPYSISNFSLYGSANSMAKAGVWVSALVITLFSGALPYVKLIAMYFCWYLPQGQLSFQKREKILNILDAIGKWSLVDSYFMVMTIVGFRFMKDFKVGVVKGGFDITVTPLFDFYCFVSATMLSLIMTHLMIRQHRLTVERDLRDFPLIKAQMEKVSKIGSKSQIQRKFLPYVIIFGIGLNIVGYFLNVFTFTFEGLAGWVVKPDNSTPYSLWKLGVMLPYKTYDPDSMGIRWLQILYFSFTLIIPIAFLIVLLIFYTVSLKLRVQKKLFVCAEILYAWSSMDVFAVAMLSILFQLGTFAKFMIGNKCSGIDQTLRTIQNLFPGIIDLDGKNTCFELQTTLNLGSIALLLGSVLFFLLGSSTLRVVQKEIEEKLENIGERKQSAIYKTSANIENNDEEKQSRRKTQSVEAYQQLLDKQNQKESQDPINM